MKTARQHKTSLFSPRCLKGIAGFTLVELLIVIAIIGILGGIAIPLFLGERSKAMHTEAKANLESLRLLEEHCLTWGDSSVYNPVVGINSNRWPYNSSLSTRSPFNRKYN